MKITEKYDLVFNALRANRDVYYLGKQISGVRCSKNGLFLEVKNEWGWRTCNVAPQFSPEGGSPLWEVVENAPEHTSAPLPMRDDADISVKYGEKFTLIYSSSFVDQKFPAGTIVSCAGFECHRDKISKKELCYPVYLFPDGTYRQEMRLNLRSLSSAPVFYKADSCGVF